ncbi:MAG: hypothetical protein HOW73_15550 [Polyangiaceae bacterium]|nr:hypothetical protein [Polyangiaceae bacterium]
MNLLQTRCAILALLVASSLAACADVRTPEGAGYRTAIKFQPAKDAPPLSAIRPEDVRVLSPKDAPDGFAFRGPQHPRLAFDYPSADQPHRKVGDIAVRESVEYAVTGFDDPAFVRRREEAVRRAAAERGANAVFLVDERETGQGTRTVRYEAYRVSDVEPVYPSTQEVIAALHLEDEGFKQVHRFSSSLTELATRKPEPIILKTGYAYMLAIAVQPGAVDMRLGEKQSLGFVVKVERDATFSQDRSGAFNRRLDKDYGPAIVTHAVVDGVFARGGAGFMGGNGLGVQIELVTRPATIEIARIDGYQGVIALGEMGVGAADFIVYERKVSAEELRRAACDHCRSTAAACSKLRPLDTCNDLNKCFQKIEKSLSVCATDYQHL